MKRIGYLMMMLIILVGFRSGKPFQKEVLNQDIATSEGNATDEPKESSHSYVSGEIEIDGDTYVLPNTEYTYTIEVKHNSYVDPYLVLQILDPNTTASLTRIGETTYTFICSGIGAYYIRAYGLLSDNSIYSLDVFPIICVDTLPF